MRRLRTKRVRLRALNAVSLLSKILVAVIVVLSLLSSVGFAQNTGSIPPAIDVLGVHNVGGRGCGACHAPHALIGSFESGVPGWMGLWQPIPASATPSSVIFGQDGRRVQVDSAHLTASSAEVAGVILCLSCHDGNVTPQNMLASQSYEQTVGLLQGSGRQPIRTLLEEDSSGRAAVDHPFGPEARIEVGNGLVFRDGEFAVIPGSPYAQFVTNYGWPSLAPLMRSNPYGVDQFGRPFLVCTTCHNQHAMNLYASSTEHPIARDGGNGRYETFFFVNGPYNPNNQSNGQITSSSSTQFCRQCHFTFSNEANNVNTIKTLF